MLNEPLKNAYLESISTEKKPEVEVKPIPPPRPSKSSYATMLAGMAGSKAGAITALQNRDILSTTVSQPSIQLSQESALGKSASKKSEQEEIEAIKPSSPGFGKR